jgi:hypothetical protein
MKKIMFILVWSALFVGCLSFWSGAIAVLFTKADLFGSAFILFALLLFGAGIILMLLDRDKEEQ